MFCREDFHFFAGALVLAIALQTCDFAVTQAFTSWSEKFDRKEDAPLELKYTPPPLVIAAPKPVEVTDEYRLQRCRQGAECSKLAEALVYEARGESLVGSIAVGYVIVERTKNPSRWPKTVRGVIAQKNQFSYTTRRQKVRPKAEDWERAYITSYEILHGEVKNPIGDSDHYHTLKVKPRWAKKMQYIATVGSHKFYKDNE